MDSGAWWATIHGIAELDTMKRLSKCTTLCGDILGNKLYLETLSASQQSFPLFILILQIPSDNQTPSQFTPSVNLSQRLLPSHHDGIQSSGKQKKDSTEGSQSLREVGRGWTSSPANDRPIPRPTPSAGLCSYPVPGSQGKIQSVIKYGFAGVWKRLWQVELSLASEMSSRL